MESIPFSSHFPPELTALINIHIASIPPGWVLTEKQVAAALAVSSWWDIHFPENVQPGENEIMCMLKDGRLAARAR